MEVIDIMMRARIARFLLENRDTITNWVKHSDIRSTPTSIVEFGRFFDSEFRLGRYEFAHRLVPDPTRAFHWKQLPEMGYPDFLTVLDREPEAYHWGNIHTHPNFPGHDTVSPDDIDFLSDPRVTMVMAATRAGDGHYKVIARWENKNDGSEDEQRFDLYPRPNLIAQFLARILNLEPWQLILADYDGDGKITIKDAMRAAQQGR